jgi:hypothetical protein
MESNDQGKHLVGFFFKVDSSEPLGVPSSSPFNLGFQFDVAFHLKDHGLDGDAIGVVV